MPKSAVTPTLHGWISWLKPPVAGLCHLGQVCHRGTCSGGHTETCAQDFVRPGKRQMRPCSDANDTHTLAVGLMDDGPQLAVALTLKGASSGGTPITITLHMYRHRQAGRQAGEDGLRASAYELQGRALLDRV